MPKLSPAQIRFLSEGLHLPDFARSARDSPASFLNDLVNAFRTYVPFSTVNVAHSMMENDGQYKTSKELFNREIFGGVGGNCASINTTLHDLATALGFESRILSGFSVSRSKTRESVHFSLLVKAEEETYYCDAGTFVPLDGAIRLDLKSSTSASRIHDYILQHRIVAGESFDSALLDPSTNWANFYPPRELRADLAAESFKLLVVVENNEIASTVIPHFDLVPKGAWLPFSALTGFTDFHGIQSSLRRNIPNINTTQPTRKLLVSGVGARTKDFVILTPYRCTKRIVNGDEEARLKMIELASFDEAVEIVREEFPTLTDLFKKALDNFSLFEKLNQGQSNI